MSATRRENIMELNDGFRRTFSGGVVTMSAGIAARQDRDAILAKVMTFDDFNTDNDPYGEHDFGAFDHEGERIFWKIDYYDVSLKSGSHDPSDPDSTTRVLTVMLTEEY